MDRGSQMSRHVPWPRPTASNAAAEQETCIFVTVAKWKAKPCCANAEAGSFLVVSLAPIGAARLKLVVHLYYAMVGVERVCVSSREYAETLNAAHGS